MSDMIRVLFADDHEVVREGLRALLSAQTDLKVVGEAADGVEAVEKAGSLQPDVILMDLMMPRKDGVTAIGEIRNANPNARILVLTSFAADEQVFPAIKAGAAGYLLKGSSSQVLLQAIRDVHRDRSSLHPSVAGRLMREISRPCEPTPNEDRLTERETEVLKLVSRGLSNRQIADRLCIAERTVGVHVTNILDKLNLANRVQAALYALREGIATL